MFWSRDPDGTQHYQGDSLNALVPGINGPTSLAAVRNADDDLARIRSSLGDLGLLEATDIIVVADHGFSTISKQSQTSATVKTRYAGTPQGRLPCGFLALDLAHALSLPLIDPDDNYKPIAEGERSKFCNGLIGGDKDKPKVVVAANGGSDLIYLPDGDPTWRSASSMPCSPRTTSAASSSIPSSANFPARSPSTTSRSKAAR